MPEPSVLSAESYLQDAMNRRSRSVTPQGRVKNWQPVDLQMKHKKVLLLHYNGLSHIQIAEEVGLTQHTVSLIVNSDLGRQFLSKLYEETATHAADVKKILDLASPLAAKNLVRVATGEVDATTKEQMEASREILDRAGYAKVAKSENVHAHLTAEDILKLKQTGRARKRLTDEDATVVADGSELDGDEG